MALTDENLVILAVYMFSFSFLFALGAKKHPMFYIFCGIVGIIFAIELGNLTRTAMPSAATIITTVLSGVSLIIIAFGFIHKIPEE